MQEVTPSARQDAAANARILTTHLSAKFGQRVQGSFLKFAEQRSEARKMDF